MTAFMNSARLWVTLGVLPSVSMCLVVLFNVLALGRWPMHPNHPHFACRTGQHGGLSHISHTGEIALTRTHRHAQHALRLTLCN